MVEPQQPIQDPQPQATESLEKSADPCRQQGERVRGGLTSNKGRKEKIGQARFEACDRVLGPELTAGKGKV